MSDAAIRLTDEERAENLAERLACKPIEDWADLIAAELAAERERPVYMLMAHVNHGCNWPIVGFTVEVDAEAVAKECNDYQATMPTKGMFAKGAPESEIDAAIARHREWAQKHPGGDAADLADSFYVSELEIRKGQ